MIRDGLTIAISLRPRSTLEPTLGRARIPTIRLTPGTLASCTCALTGAVDLTSVAGSTDEGHCATTSAQKASKRFGHRRSSNNRRAHRHTSTRVLCLQHARTRWVGRGARHRFGLLRLSRCRVCFLRSFLRSLCTVGIEQPSPPAPRKARLLVLMETVELRSHRFHSVTTATE